MADRKYRLTIPEVLDDELRDVAERMEMSLHELLQRFIKIGLMVHRVGLSEDEKLFIRAQDGGEKEVTLL